MGTLVQISVCSTSGGTVKAASQKGSLKNGGCLEFCLPEYGQSFWMMLRYSGGVSAVKYSGAGLDKALVVADET